MASTLYEGEDCKGDTQNLSSLSFPDDVGGRLNPLPGLYAEVKIECFAVVSRT